MPDCWRDERCYCYYVYALILPLSATNAMLIFYVVTMALDRRYAIASRYCYAVRYCDDNMITRRFDAIRAPDAVTLIATRDDDITPYT